MSLIPNLIFVFHLFKGEKGIRIYLLIYQIIFFQAQFQKRPKTHTSSTNYHRNRDRNVVGFTCWKSSRTSTPNVSATTWITSKVGLEDGPAFSMRAMVGTPTLHRAANSHWLNPLLSRKIIIFAPKRALGEFIFNDLCNLGRYFLSRAREIFL